jgi:hypothetical protein
MALQYLRERIGAQPYPRFVVRHTKSGASSSAAHVNARQIEVLTLLASPDAAPRHFRMLSENSEKYYYEGWLSMISSGFVAIVLNDAVFFIPQTTIFFFFYNNFY